MDYNFLVLEYFLLGCVLLMVMLFFEKEIVYLLLFYSIVFHMKKNRCFHRISYHNKESVLILIKLDEEDIVLMEIFDESFYEVLIQILYLLCFYFIFCLIFFYYFFFFGFLLFDDESDVWGLSFILFFLGVENIFFFIFLKIILFKFYNFYKIIVFNRIEVLK